MICNPKKDISKNKCDHIIHISDLHIRNGTRVSSRFDEYKTVFGRTLEKIKEISIRHNIITVVTGDVFHDKTKLTSYGIYLYNFFFENLSKICKVFIIRGNHDFDQANMLDTSEYDLLNSFQIHKNENIEYLLKTGIHEWNNIGFGLVSIEDILENGTGSGTIENFPEFPKPEFTNKVEKTVALFHGVVKNSQFFSKTCDTGINLSWFSGYDYVMLGDIHKFQFLKENAAYASSLIQQNFGETIDNHGFIEWDIYNNQHRFHNIKNDIGYLTAKFHNDAWFFNTNDILNLPRTLKVKIKGNPSLESIENLKRDFSNKDITLVNKVNLERIDKIEMVEIKNKSISVIHPGEFKNSSLKLDILGNSCMQIIETKTNDLMKQYQKIDECMNFDGLHVNTCYKLLDIEFSDIFCFKGVQKFNFKRLQNSISLISGKNGSGKTTFINVILVAIFGKCPRKIQTSSDNAYTRIKIEIDGITYNVSRFFNSEGKPRRKGGVIKEDNTIVCRYHTETNKFINSQIGDYKQCLSTIFLTQENSNDYLKIKDEEKLKNFEIAISMDLENKKLEYLNKSEKNIRSILKNVNNIKDFKTKQEEIPDSPVDLDTINFEIREIQKKKAKISSKLSELESRSLEFSKKMQEIDENVNRVNSETSYDIIELSKQNMVDVREFIEIPSDYLHVKKTCEEILKKDYDESYISTNHSMSNDELEDKLEKYKSIPVPMCPREYDIDNRLEYHSKFESRIERFQKEIEDTKRKNELRKNINELKNNMKNISFNKDCHACRSHPTRIILNRLTNEYDSLNSYEKIEKKQEILENLKKINVTYLKKWKEYENVEEKIRKLQEIKNDRKILKTQADRAFAKAYLYITRNITEISHRNKCFFAKQYSMKMEDLHRKKKTIEVEYTGINASKEEIKNELNYLEKNEYQRNIELKSLEKNNEKFEKYHKIVKNIDDIMEFYNKTLENIFSNKVELQKRTKEKLQNFLDVFRQNTNTLINQVEPRISVHMTIANGELKILPRINDVSLDNTDTLSGFEKFIVSFCCRISLMMFSNRENFLILDEPFVSFDSFHLSKINDLLEFILENVQFVLIISHIEKIRELINTCVVITDYNLN